MSHFLNSLFVRLVLLLALAFISRMALSQDVNPAPASVIRSHTMWITYHKTSSIIFPARIKSVDRGSRDVIVRKASEVDNVLQLKANRENFPETNLTVITADGVLHHFTINYHDDPETLSLDLAGSHGGEDESARSTILFRQELTESDLEACAQGIVGSDKVTRIKKVRKYKVGMLLKGIYIRENVLFFHLVWNNDSNISYDVEFFRFFIQDRERIRRTASQDVSMQPLFVYGNDKLIPASTRQNVVVALPKFTIPDARNLVIEMFEQRGGRHLRLTVANRNIVRAKRIA